MSTAVSRPLAAARAGVFAMPQPAAGAVPARAARLWRGLGQNWSCMGPRCAERNGLRAWWKWPGRVQLQQGWCCSPECFQAAFESLANRILRGPDATLPSAASRPHRIPIGLTLLSHGLLTREQLRAALDAQLAHGGRLGENLVRLGLATEDTVAAGVALQWARPTFPLAQSQAWRQCAGWVPLAMIESLRMLPLLYVPARKRLYVGFTQVVEAHAANALGEVLGCSVESCIITDSAFNAALEQFQNLPVAGGPQDVGFDHLRYPDEVAGVVRQYARYADARQVRAAAAGPFLWVRIRGERDINLTFRYRE